jgi:hypothetical protein
MINLLIEFVMFLLDFFCCSDNYIDIEKKVSNDFSSLNFKENLQQEINNETVNNDFSGLNFKENLQQEINNETVNNDFFGLNFNFKENLQQEINNEIENDDFFKNFNEK